MAAIHKTPVLIVVLFFFYGRQSFSQSYNISGTWQGDLGQDDKTWLYDMTLNLTQVKNTIYGTAKFVVKDGSLAYVVHNINGVIKGDSIQLIDLAVKEENDLSGRWYWCKKIYSGKIVVNQDSLLLSGNWRNEGKKMFHYKQLLENTGVGCPPGTFRVARINEHKKANEHIDELAQKVSPVSGVDNSKISGSLFMNRKTAVTNTIEVVSDSIKLSFFDNGEIDDDTISVYYNKVLILDHQRLSDQPFEITIAIKPNTANELLMFAENEGSIPPNTALLIFTDDGKRREITLDSDTKKSGTIIFHKN